MTTDVCFFNTFVFVFVLAFNVRSLQFSL